MRTIYHPAALSLHWIIFVLVVVTLPMGLIMTRRDFDPTTDMLYTLHWSFGFTILALMTVRVLIRIFNRPPPPAAILSGWQRDLSGVIHGALYGMLFVIPFLGWLGKSAYGAGAEGIDVFYLFHMPVLIEKDEHRADNLLAAHGIAARIFLALLVIHVAGALYHALFARDGVAGRMGLGRKVAEPER